MGPGGENASSRPNPTAAGRRFQTRRLAARGTLIHTDGETSVEVRQMPKGQNKQEKKNKEKLTTKEKQEKKKEKKTKK
jgi:hypothetical protein